MDPYGHSLGPRLGGGYGTSIQNVQPLIGMGTNANAAEGAGRQSSDMSASQMEDAAFAARMLGLSGDLLGSSGKPAATAAMLGSSMPAQQAFSQGTQQAANIPGMQQQTQQAQNIPGMQQQQQQQQQQFNPATAAALLRNTHFNQGLLQQPANIQGMQQLQQSLKNYGLQQQQQPQPEVGMPAIQQQQQPQPGISSIQHQREMERQPNVQMMNSGNQEKQGGFSNDVGGINQQSQPRQDRSNPSMSPRRIDNQIFERSQDDRRGNNTRGNDSRGNDRRSSGRDGGNHGDQRRSQGRGGGARDNKDRGSRDRYSGGGSQSNQAQKVVDQAAQLQQLQTQLKLQETLDRLQRLEESQKKKDQHMEEMEEMLRKRKRDDTRNMSSKHPRQELSSRQDPPRGPYFEAGPPPNIDPYMDSPPMINPYMEPADHNMVRDYMDDPRHDPRGEMVRDFMDAPRQEPNRDMGRDFMETPRRSRSHDMARDFNDRRSPSHAMAKDIPPFMPGGRGRGAGRGRGMARGGSDRSRTTPRGGSDGGRGPSRSGSDRGRGKPRGSPGQGGVKRLTPNAPVGQDRGSRASRPRRSRGKRSRQNSSGDTGQAGGRQQQVSPAGGRQQQVSPAGGHQQQGRRSAGQQQVGHSGLQPGSRSGGPQRGGRRGGPQLEGPSRQQDGRSGVRSQQQQRIQQKGKLQQNVGGPPPGQSRDPYSAYMLQQKAISLLPMNILANSNYRQSDLEKAYYQEMNKITENLVILPELSPAKKDISVIKFCYGCGKDEHVISQCPDPVIRKEYEMEIAALGSTTVSHQMKLFSDTKFRDHIYNKKLHNLHCYFCNSKSKSLGEYYIHVENKTHQKNVDKLCKTMVGDPNRIPLVMQLAELPNVQAEESKTGELPNVQAEAKESKTGEKGEASTQDKTKDEDYSFLCQVCRRLVAGTWEVHCKTKKHQLKLEYSPRCTTCRMYNYPNRKNHENTWLHMRMIFLSRRSRNVPNRKESELTARSKSAVKDKPTAKDKPVAKDNKPAAKDKLADKQEATKSESEPGIPSGAVAGMEFVFPVTGWFCKVCQKFYPNVSKVDHCSQDIHHVNLVEWCRKRDISMATLLKRYLAKDNPSSSSSKDELNSSDLVVIDDVAMNDESDADPTQMESSTTDQLIELSDEVNEEAGVQGDDGIMDVDKIGSGDEDEDVDIEGEDEKWDGDERKDSFYGDPEGHLIGDDDCEDDDNFEGMEDEEDILEDAPAEMSGDVTGDKNNEADEQVQVDEEAKPVEDGGRKESGQDGGDEAEKDEGVKGKQGEGEKEEKVEGKKEEKVEEKEEEKDEVEKGKQDEGKKEEQEGDQDGGEKGEQDENVQGKQDDGKKEEQDDEKKEEQEGDKNEGKKGEQGGEKEKQDAVTTGEGKTEESKDATDKEVATEAKPGKVTEKTTPLKRTRRTTRKK